MKEYSLCKQFIFYQANCSTKLHVHSLQKEGGSLFSRHKPLNCWTPSAAIETGTQFCKIFRVVLFWPAAVSSEQLKVWSSETWANFELYTVRSQSAKTSLTSFFVIATRFPEISSDFWPKIRGYFFSFN